MAAVLARCFEGGESLPSDASTTVWRALEDTLAALVDEGLFTRAVGPFLVPTERGRAAWRRLSSLLEGARRLDVLASVNLRVELDETVSDDGVDVREGVPDPRFQPPTSDEEAAERGTEDMRAAVLGHLSGASHARDDDGWRVTLVLALAEGRLTGEGAWFELAHGMVLEELAERASTAYHPRDVSDDAAEVDDVLRHIYEAGVVEARRRSRERPRCLTCGGQAPATSLWCPPCEDAWLTTLGSRLL